MNVKGMIKSNKGFSLVELMVVVAIIGILAAIAVPNVNRYMLKSRQGEAKTNLGSLYTSEKSFFTEHTAYVTDLGSIGFTPEGQIRYNVGFTAAGTNFQTGLRTDANINVSGDDTYALVVGGAASRCVGGCSVYQVGSVPNIPAGFAIDNTATPRSFLAAAIAPFGTYGGTGNDQWQINHNKALTQVSSGL